MGSFTTIGLASGEFIVVSACATWVTKNLLNICSGVARIFIDIGLLWPFFLLVQSFHKCSLRISSRVSSTLESFALVEAPSLLW